MKPVYLIVELKDEILTELKLGIKSLYCAYTTLKVAKTVFHLVQRHIPGCTLLKITDFDCEYLYGKKPVYCNCDD